MEKNTTLNGEMQDGFGSREQDASDGFTICIEDSEGRVWPHVVSLLVGDSDNYSKVFYNETVDLPLSLCNIRISKKQTKDCIKFRTNFKSDDCSSELGSRIAVAVADAIPLENTFLAIAKIGEFAALVKEVLNVSHREATAFIEILIQPNEYIERMLEHNHTAQFLVTSNVETPDLYAVVLGSEEDLEFLSIKRIINDKKQHIDKKALLLLCHTDSKQDAVRKRITSYAATIDDYAKYVYPTSFSEFRNLFAAFLDIHDDLFVYSNIHTCEVDLLENGFFRGLGIAMESKKTLPSTVGTPGEDTQKVDRDFVLEFLRGIPTHNHSLRICTSYTKQDFHGSDEYGDIGYTRISSDSLGKPVLKALGDAREEEKTLLLRYAEKKQEESQDLHRSHLALCLHMYIVTCVNSDFGLGTSDISNEETPPRIMRVEESIFAKEILEELDKNTEWGAYRYDSMSKLYSAALKKCGIRSDSWDHVRCSYQHRKKLEIIRDVIGDVTTPGLPSFILYTHIRGLRAYAEYEILKGVGMSEEEAMQTLYELPF